MEYADIITALAKISKTQKKDTALFAKSAIVVMCADNGVAVEFGVNENIAELAVKIANAETSYNRAAKTVGIDLFTVNVGIKGNAMSEWIIDRKTAEGTKNITRESAMTKEEVSFAVRSGIEIVKSLKVGEYNIVCAASVSSCGRIPAEAIVSYITGYNQISQPAKIALEINSFSTPTEMLQKVGSFEIAAMAGIFLGGLICGMPVVIDNDISAVAALVAFSIDPRTLSIMTAAHQDGILSRIVYQKLDLIPVLDTSISEPVIGAAMALSILNIAASAK